MNSLSDASLRITGRTFDRDQGRPRPRLNNSRFGTDVEFSSVTV